MTRTRPLMALTLLVTVAATVLLTTCSDHSTDSRNDDVVIHEPWPDEEAEMLALDMSDEVIASRVHYDQVRYDLEAIRAGWGVTYPRLKHIRYRPTWVPGRLDLGVSESVFESIGAGTYTAWDALNQYYQLDYFARRNLGTEFVVTLYFLPRLNAALLAEEYKALPGVASARPVLREVVTSNIAARRDGAERWYLFWDQEESCRPGCSGSQSWQFYACPEGVRYEGGWGPGVQTVLRLDRTPGLGFCPEGEKLFSVVVEADTNGNQILHGSWLRSGDPTQDVCNPEMMGCLVTVALIPRTLTPTEVSALDVALTAIPIEDHVVDGACDPCLITRYEFEERVEYANPCATSSSAYDASITALETLLHTLVFSD